MLSPQDGDAAKHPAFLASVSNRGSLWVRKASVGLVHARVRCHTLDDRPRRVTDNAGGLHLSGSQLIVAARDLSRGKLAMNMITRSVGAVTLALFLIGGCAIYNTSSCHGQTLSCR